MIACTMEHRHGPLKRFWHLILLIAEPCIEVYDLITDGFFVYTLFYNTRHGYPEFFTEFAISFIILLITVLVFSTETLNPLFGRLNPCDFESIEEVPLYRRGICGWLWRWSCWYELLIHKRIVFNEEIDEELMDLRQGWCRWCASGRHGALLFIEDIPQMLIALSVLRKDNAPTRAITQKIIAGTIAGLLRAKTWIFG